MDLISWCNRFIKIGYYLLFGLVPLLLTPWNYELFEYNKMMAVYALTVVIVGSWITKSIAQREIRLCRTPLDIPIFLFVTSQLISTLFSIDPHVSWMGYYSRFNGGMWSVISYVLLYYAYVSNLANWSNWTNLLKTALLTATLVAIYGVLERLGIDKHLWVQDVQNRVFSTLGQPNWLAAYLVALIPLTMMFGLKKKLYYLLSLLFFVVLLFTRSRSGLLGFVIADIVFWLAIVMPDLIRHPSSKKQNTGFRIGGRNDTKIAIALHAIFVLIIFINGTGVEKLDRFSLKGITVKQEATQSATPVVGPALESGGTESGTIRTYVWQAALNAWNSSWKTRAIGTGTETFAFAFYHYRPIGHNQTSEWDFLYNKAHNEYLNFLATTGVFGLGSYLLFIGTFIWWFIRIVIPASKPGSTQKITWIPGQARNDMYNYALFAGWISILITNFFGFSVVVTQLFLFLFPAMIIASKPDGVIIVVKPMRVPRWMIWILLLGGIAVLIRIGSFWYADTLYARGYRLVRSGLFGQAIPAFVRAIDLNGNEPAYHDELGSAYATLAVSAFEGSNATQAAQLATLAINESIQAITTSPQNVNYYKTRTKIYYTLSQLEPTFNAKAVESLEYAVPLSPNDPKIYYNLAILVGREGASQKAIEYLQKAKALKPNYRDAYYALWVFFTEEKKSAEARAILQEYITNVDPNDKDFIEKMK